MAYVPQEVSLPAINIPVFDRSSGLMTDPWYRFFEAMFVRTGKDTDKVQVGVVKADTAQGTADEAKEGLLDKVSKTTEVIAGNGLTGGGALEGDVTLVAAQDTGWTAATGTEDKGSYAAYAGQALGVGYVQADAQQTDDAIKAASQRLLAIENALRTNGAIDG